MHLISRADRASDTALVEGVALGDAPAVAAFVRRFQSAVFGLAVSITRDAAVAEDVAQEVFCGRGERRAAMTPGVARC